MSEARKWLEVLKIVGSLAVCLTGAVLFLEYVFPRFPVWIQITLYGVVSLYFVVAVGRWCVDRFGKIRMGVSICALGVSIGALLVAAYYFVPIRPFGVTLSDCRQIYSAYADASDAEFMDSPHWDDWPVDSSMDRTEAKDFFAAILTASELDLDYETFRDKAMNCNHLMEYVEERASSD